MNQETINQLSKYYPKLSDIAKRQFAADLLEDSLKPGTISLIVNTETNEQINLQEVVKQKGKDVAVTVVQKILSNGINAKTGGAAMAFDSVEIKKDEFNKFMKSLKNGDFPKTKDEFMAHLTEFRKAFFGDTDEETPSEEYSPDYCQTQEDIMKLVLSDIQIAQDEYDFPITINNLIYPVQFLSILSLVHDETSELYAMRSAKPGAVFDIVTQIAKDIENVLDEHFTTPVSDDMLLMGLLTLAVHLSNEKPRMFIPSDKMAEILEWDSNECECDGNCAECTCD